MQAETTSSDPWQRRWRPFIGYVTGATFGVTCVFTLVLLGIAIFQRNADAMRAIPDVVNTMTLLFGVPGAILGIASWGRSKAEVARAGGGG